MGAAFGLNRTATCEKMNVLSGWIAFNQLPIVDADRLCDPVTQNSHNDIVLSVQRR